MSNPTFPPAETDVLRHTIRSAGLKVTQPRVAVLAALQRHPHSSADRIFTEVQKELTSSSTQAVYGILAAFTGAGLARRFDPPGTPALFEQRVGDNHHHLVCVHCGEIQDVDCVVGEAPCLTPSNDYGYAVLSAEVTFSGICRDCANAVAVEAAEVAAAVASDAGTAATDDAATPTPVA